MPFAERLSAIFRAGTLNLTSRPKGNLPVLDVLRTVAILLVFCDHFAGQFEALPAVMKLPFIQWGWTGVDLFFVLSGFLIGTQLWTELHRTGRIRIGRFLLRRGLRIWPLYFSFVVLVAAEAILGSRPASGLWADAAFLSNYFHNQIGGGWSLSTEEQFYILAPIGISLAARKVNPGRLWIIGFAIVVTLASREFTILRLHSAENVVRNALYFHLHTHCDGLLVGLLLSWCSVFAPGSIRNSRVRISAAAAMCVIAVGIYKIQPVLFNFTTLGLLYGAAVVLWLGSDVRHGFVRWNGFYIVSRLSYGIYLNHFGLLPWLRELLLPLRLKYGEPAFWICMALAWASSLLIAAITFYAIEWPFLMIRSRWLASERKSAETAVAMTA